MGEADDQTLEAEFGHLEGREALIFQIGFGQALAQPREVAKSDKPWMDRRIFKCPECGAFGLNTMWGVSQYECGAEIHSDGEFAEPCPNETAPTPGDHS